jgi:hypothetical protein
MNSPFLIGVATSGYQSEGGYNAPGQPHNNWATSEQSGRVARTGTASDFWNRYRDDFALSRGMGLNAFRLSIECARVQPSHSPGSAHAPDFDFEVIDQYAARIAACRESGLEPVVTLHHFTHPAWLGVDAWLDDSTPAALQDFVETTVTRLTGLLMQRAGKTVAVADAPAIISGDKPAQGFVTLPNGAEGVKLQVYNDKGQIVATQVMGAQKMGDMPWVWDGSNDAGSRVPDGNYFFKATVVSQGKTTTPSVNVLSTVTGVNQAIDKSIMLEVAGGKSVKLTDVQRIGS